MKKLIFITGASSGIGRALTIKFASNGWMVVAAARRLDLIKKIKINNTISNAIVPIKMDVTNKKVVNSKIKYILKNYGTPDIVLLNAGTNNPNSKKIFSIEETEQIFETNFFGTLNCLSSILPSLKKKHKSQVIFMSSVAGYRGLPYASAYCSSKSAITTFAESIYNQCKGFGIAIRVVNPGFIKTPLTDKNKFKMPMIMSVEKAANIMYEKFIFSKKFEISCPWFFCIIMKILRVLPYKSYFALTQLLIKKL